MTILLVLLAQSGVATAGPREQLETRDGAGSKRKAAPAPAAGADDARAESLPTEEEIRQAFEGGDYKGALQRLSRVVNLKGGAGAAYDRYTLLMLKGESHLRLKQLKPAGEAFAAAARETDDEMQAAAARATQRLLAEARAFQIKRRVPAKGKKVQTADVLDPDQREAALRILYEDVRAVTRPKLEAALRARKLPPIAEALKLAEGLRDLELAATGGDADLNELRDDLSARARTLMSKALDRLAKDVDELKESANQLVERRRRRTTHFGGSPTTGGGFAAGEEVLTKRRGLHDTDAEDLREIMQTCRQIIEAAESLAQAEGGDPDEAEELIDRASAIGRSANRVLNDRYGPQE